MTDSRLCIHAQLLICVSPFVTLWTVVYQTPLSMGFSRQEYRSELPFLPPGDLTHQETESVSLTLASRFFTTVPHGKPNSRLYMRKINT